MHPIKIAIFKEIRRNPESGCSELSDDEMNLTLFHRQDSLRLSLAGFIQVKKLFTAYSFEIPATIKSRHRMALSKLVYPYFFTTKRLILFSDSDAMMIKLQGGIEQFLETCYQLDR